MPRNDAFLGHLSEVPLFSAAMGRDLALVARRAEDVQVEAGRILVSEGATGAEFFVILSGTAKVSRRGRKVATLGPGTTFGELALLDHGPRTATVTAATDLKVLVIAAREFAEILDEVPPIAHKLLKSLAAMVRELDTKTFG